MSAAINYADSLPCRAQTALNQYDDSIPAHVEAACDEFEAEATACLEAGLDYTTGRRSVLVGTLLEKAVDHFNEGGASDGTLAEIIHAALRATDDPRQAVLCARLVRQAVGSVIEDLVGDESEKLQTELLKGE